MPVIALLHKLAPFADPVLCATCVAKVYASKGMPLRLQEAFKLTIEDARKLKMTKTHIETKNYIPKFNIYRLGFQEGRFKISSPGCLLDLRLLRTCPSRSWWS